MGEYVRGYLFVTDGMCVQTDHENARALKACTNVLACEGVGGVCHWYLCFLVLEEIAHMRVCVCVCVCGYVNEFPRL